MARKNRLICLILFVSPTSMIYRTSAMTGSGAFVSLVNPSCGRRKVSSMCLFSTTGTTPAETSSIAIVGGGLAGLATAHHLLRKSPGTKITIFDKALPGLGGASSVAGGLLHPLSPRGKLVHLGREGLVATNRLLDAAAVFREECVLQEEIYRVAVNDDHVATLIQTAEQLPDLAEWVKPDDLPWDAPPAVLGGLRLHSGCKVVHMPTYLKGLWEAVQSAGTSSKDWVIVDDLSPTGWKNRLREFDVVVLSAGSGLFHDSIMEQKLPVQLVRGQSIEMTLNTATCDHAMLCGKYVSPLPQKNRVLIGATHEFNEKPLDPEQVRSELQDRSLAFASNLWEDGAVDKITTGFRVQSKRENFGRVPIVGKLHVDFHDNVWIYTGLSSRGLLHHGIFGEILANKILSVPSDINHPNLDWWHEN